MPLDYVCPFCHAKFFVDDAFRGKSGPCAECGKSITIPGRVSNHSENEADQRASAIVARERNAYRLQIVITASTILFASLILGLVIYIGMPGFQKISIRREARSSLSNLQKIAKALNEYAVEHGTYPPAVVYDSAGTALYSWRVLILPYLGHQAIYDNFKLDEAYDGPHNSQYMYQVPNEFRLLGSPSNRFLTGETYVSLVTGPGTLFPTKGTTDPKTISDLPSTTILVTEASRVINLWTAPHDCAFTASTSAAGATNTDIGVLRQGFVLAVTVDGTELTIPDTINKTKLHALVTPNGEEPIEATEFKSDNLNSYIGD
jgi:type II secretory pathway pseudopilin PulG